MPKPSTPRQPWLHRLSVCVDGNVTALSDDAGEMDGDGACGVYVDDRRVVSVLQLLLAGEAPSPVARSSSGGRSDFVGSARSLGDAGADPTVELHRRRTVRAMGLEERVVVVSRAAAVVEAELLVRLAGDGADISAVKGGDVRCAALPATAEDTTLCWRDDRHEVRVSCDAPAAVACTADGSGGGSFRVPVRLEPGTACEVALTVAVTRTQPSLFDAGPGSAAVDWSAVSVRAQDSAVEPTVRAGLDDLQHLLLTDPEDPRDVFAGAGTPWYLTLFGRDSLWTARMALPFGTELAAGTLRALARRQGRVLDPSCAEAPGKIPHEVRRAVPDDAAGLALPPTYYGTVDATALWICLLHDAWRWGMPVDEVRSLLPALRAATGWLRQHASPDGDGLLKYLDTTGTGLANQGWKDSGDAIRWRDGRVADAPIALVEAQAYAVEAAGCAATLLEAFGEAGADELRGYAEGLRERVRSRFWVGHDSPGGPWLGLAVDGQGSTVDGLGSNMGHVLGTGTLDAAESARVAATLVSDRLLDTYGVRTLASDNGGFNPIGYHTGSIWTHDTAICAWNLSRAGHPAQAALVVRTLLSSSVAFGHRWPELYAGATTLDQPAPYPAACRPQAWAAASAAVLVSVSLGLEPDLPSGRLVLRPCRPAPFGEMTVEGLRAAGRTFGVHCAADGSVTVLDAPDGLDVEVVQPGAARSGA